MAASILALEDGRVFEGDAFGAPGTATGEVCFNTSMSGYQEALTDPSYRGQILAMTYPLIGNYGTNELDQESATPHVRGFIIGELSPTPSNWRSERSLSDYLTHFGIPGIEDIDTRALTRHLRTLGSMRGCLTTELTSREAVERAQQCEGVVGMDFVREVTPASAYDWDPEGTLSREWTVVTGSQADALDSDERGNAFLPAAPIRQRIVAYDFGMKRNILRKLRHEGFDVHVVPAHTPAEAVLERDPDGVFLSNGPGDPAALTYAHEACRKIVGKKPVFGICLGHQVLGYAFGGRTFKLKFGHRGGNQPVQEVSTGKVSITSQNHGFAVDAASLPSEIEVTHVNLNDGTVAGMRHREYPVFSVQYHPEAAPGPNDAAPLFARFADLIDAAKSAG